DVCVPWRVFCIGKVAVRLVSEDQQLTLILFQMAATDINDPLVLAIRNVVDRYADRLTVRLTGHAALTQELNHLLRADIDRLMPPVLAVIVAVLYFSFRTASGVLLPLASVGISVIWTLGLKIGRAHV